MINADQIKLIDSNFFFANRVADDQVATKLMINTVEELKKYDKSVVIFDLDSIAGVSKEYGELETEIPVATRSALERPPKEGNQDNGGTKFKF